MSNGDQSIYAMAKCPACSTENRLTMSPGSDELPVLCSHCGLQLGRVGELVAATTRSTAKKGSAALSRSEQVAE